MIIDTLYHDNRTMVVISGHTFDPKSAYISFSAVSARAFGNYQVGSIYSQRIMPIASSRLFSMRLNPALLDDALASPSLLPYSFNWADLNSYVQVLP